jgi:hypothetical protein
MRNRTRQEPDNGIVELAVLSFAVIYYFLLRTL